MTLDVTSGEPSRCDRGVFVVVLSRPESLQRRLGRPSRHAYRVVTHENRSGQSLAAEGVEAAEHTNGCWRVRVDPLCDRCDRPAVLDPSVDIWAEPVRNVAKLLAVEGIDENRLRVHLVVFLESRAHFHGRREVPDGAHPHGG